MTIVSLVIVNVHVITLKVKSGWGRRELGGGETIENATLTMQEKSFLKNPQIRIYDYCSY